LFPIEKEILLNNKEFKMKKKFIDRESEHVLKYLFDFKDSVTVDLYFERVRIYLSNVLYNEKNLSEKHIAPSLENKEVCKQIFSTVLIMMYLPLSLDYLEKTKSYKINEEIDYDYTNPKSVLYTVIINVKDFMKRIPEEYFISPASTKYHGAFSGGLMHHSLGVLKSVLDTCDVYLMDKYTSLYLTSSASSDVKDANVEIRHDICANLAAILLHDFCKVGKYKFIEDKKKYEYNYDSDPSFQHGAESYRRIIHEGFHLSKEWELAVVYHMGVFDVSKQEMIDFSSITEKVPEVLLLHHADMISSKILHI
jgi:hypothetical protein